MSVRPAWRLVAAAGLVIGLTIVPVRHVAACDCAVMDLPQAIDEADVAIVGTLVGAGGAGSEPASRPVTDSVEYVWAVERSRDPIDAIQITIAAVPNDGANCGMTFEVGGRWLVLAYGSEGRLETNGCLRNMPLDGASPDDLAAIDALVAVPVESGAGAAAGPSVPAPLLIGGAGLLVVAGASLLAFRRADPR